MKVLENKSLMPSKIAKALADHKYTLEGVTIEVAGVVEKSGDGFVFVARASGQRYVLKLGDVEGATLVADKARLTIAGGLTEAPEKDGKKPPPVIEVSSAKELKEERRK